MRVLTYILLIGISSALFSCGNSTSDRAYLTQTQLDSIERVRVDSIHIADSIAAIQKLIADSIASVEREASLAKLNNLSKNFVEKKDEFSEYSWVKHKNSPKYRNQNGVYLSFQKTANGSSTNLRFVIQYEDDDWLFIRNIIFNIDGENITFIPDDMQRDHDSRIWEWSDESAEYSMDLISKIANAKSVKLKLNGQQYYDTRSMSPSAIKAFKETLEYYNALKAN